MLNNSGNKIIISNFIVCTLFAVIIVIEI